MTQTLYIKKLVSLKSLLVPSLFAEKQFDVLVKKLQNKKLSQTEKNYLSNALKRKIKAIASIKHVNLNLLYAQREKKKELVYGVIASYKKSGIELIGYPTKGRALPSTKTIKEVIAHYQELDARIVDLLPVYILKNLRNIDIFEIYDFAIENSLVNITGYLFNVLYYHHPTEQIKKLLYALEKHKDKIPIFRDPRYENIFRFIPQDSLSREWNMFTLTKIEQYAGYFQLYAEAS